MGCSTIRGGGTTNVVGRTTTVVGLGGGNCMVAGGGAGSCIFCGGG